ncbi:lysylphosphatidylglycerol synthase transmembrane domain-containing protein [Paenibacillus sp. OAS669]|uniref:lysylphosphatidylglycerol synthase transmembrane domain-containing protein n=1 Tax=Paenibacillus sp. OAS669 TaxID=2663821 RepID=UPI00178BF1EB|nr:lysylphosphatidylglycerol synthase transmembrane domain-containing protein [Paenibacillus sp. OAS669]MBE1445667.1 hypothetical protein [Paenibacillus sp. OAS669]
MNKKIIINFLIGLLFSVIALYVLFSKFTIQDLSEGFKHINYFWLVLTIFTIILSMVIRTKVWSYLVHTNNFSDIRKLFYTLMFGYAVNNVLPARLGDISRIYVCWKELKISRSLTIVSLMIEKLMDMIWLFVLLFTIIVFMRSYTELFYNNSIIFMIVFIVFMICLSVIYICRNIIINFIKNKFIEKKIIVAFINKINEIINSIPNKRIIVKALFLHLFTWVSSLLAVWFSTKAFGLIVTPMVALLILVLTNLGMLIPSTPGAIGIYHYLTYIALTIFNIDSSVASTFAIFLHLIQYLTVVVVGFICWLVLSISSKKNQTSLNLKQFLSLRNSNNKSSDISYN